MGRWLAALSALVVIVASLPGTGGTEPDEAWTPMVTLDVLPLGIPPERLAPESRARADAVLNATIFAHRVGGLRYRSREEVFQFLLEHPDFAASVARALALGEYRLTPHDDGYWGDDNRGATGTVRVLHAEPGRRLFHLAGRYERPLLPTIEGQLLLLLEFQHETDQDGSGVVEASLTGHLQLDTPIVGAVAQLIAALTRPLVERAVERKVRRFFRTVARVSRWAHDEPEQLVALLEGHPEVAPGPMLAFRSVLLANRPPAWARLPFGLAPGDDSTPGMSAPRLLDPADPSLWPGFPGVAPPARAE